MMKKILPAMTALAVAGILSAFTVLPEVEVGKAVPEFSLKGIDGKTYSISELKGTIVVLEWTNPNCPYVQRVYRDGIMTGVQKKYGDKVAWFAVNSTNPEHGDFESADDLAKKYKSWNASFATILLDPDGAVGRMFDAKTTPHMFVIDKEGKLVYAGGIDDDARGNKTEKTNYVDHALSLLLEGKSVKTTTSRPYGCSVKYAP